MTVDVERSFNGPTLMDLRKLSLLNVVAACLAACAACAGPEPTTARPSPPSAVEADYERACTGVSAEDRLSCPIVKWSRSIDDVDGGIVLHLGPEAPPPEQTERRALCHRAWMTRYGRSMPGPLSAAGRITIVASAGAEGTDITFSASDPAQIEDLRARTHRSFQEHHH